MSKTVLEKYNIRDKVELVLEKGYIIIKPIAQARKDWEEAFKTMHEEGDDQLLLEDVFEEENFDDWK